MVDSNSALVVVVGYTGSRACVVVRNRHVGDAIDCYNEVTDGIPTE
jgi:hypothetical protein